MKMTFYEKEKLKPGLWFPIFKNKNENGKIADEDRRYTDN